MKEFFGRILRGKKKEEPKTYDSVHNPKYPEEADVSFGERISTRDIPEEVRKEITLRLTRGVRLDDVERISHGPDDTTYIILEEERTPVNPALTEEERQPTQRVLIVDYVNGTAAGYLMVARSEAPDRWGLVGVPFVADTGTYSTQDFDFKGKGLGSRRLDVANNYCIKIYGQPLHSGVYFESDEAKKMWTDRYADGRAEIAADDPVLGKRYRYKV